MSYSSYLLESILSAEPGSKFLQLVCRANTPEYGQKHLPIPEPGQHVCFFPGNHKARFKSVFHGDLPGKYRIMIKGLRRSELKSGGVLVPMDTPVKECREALILMHEALPERTESLFVRVQGGLHSQFNAQGLIPGAEMRSCAGSSQLWIIRFHKPYPLCLGDILSFYKAQQHGPPLLSLSGRTAFIGSVPSTGKARKSLVFNASGMSEMQKIVYINMVLRDFMFLPADYPNKILFPANSQISKEFNAKIISYEKQKWLVKSKRLENIRCQILKITKRCGGIHCKSLKENLREAGELPSTLLLAIAHNMVQEGIIQKREEWFFYAGPDSFSPFHRSLLEKVKNCGCNGLPVREVRGLAENRTLEELRRSRLICGGNKLWFERQILEEMSGKLLQNMTAGQELAMAEVKARLGGSRVLRIEILNILEEEGCLSSLKNSVRKVL